MTQLGAVLMAAALLAPSSAAMAQASDSESPGKGNSILQIGMVHIDTLDKSRPLSTSLQPGLAALGGVQGDFVSEGSGATVSDSETLALIYLYSLTDHIALKFEGGIPARFELYGEGLVQPTGPLGQLINVDLGDPQNNPLTKVTQYSPVFMVTYSFREAAAAIRPILGLGVTYTWFRGIKFDQDFKDQLNRQFGATLALANLDPGPTRVSAKSAADIAPVFNAGVSADLSPRWNLTASITFIPLKTTARIMIDADSGERLATSSTKLDLNPLVVALLLGYRFNLDLL